LAGQPLKRFIMTIDIRPLAEADPRAVESLLDAAFGQDRHTRTAYRLRAGTEPIAALSFAMFDAARLVATLQSWPVVLIDAVGTRHPLVLLGPIAVSPSHQRSGYGRAITGHAVRAADETGTPALVLIGDPEYYGRWFGFAADATAGWSIPGPVERRRLLARTAPGVMLPGTAELAPDLDAPKVSRSERLHA
jgi:predicted N-acetyltransferase YhbS